MANDARIDQSHLPQATEEEIRLLLRRAGLDLPQDLLRQFLAAWPQYEAMVRRIPRSRPYDEEPAHSFRPSRFF
jgi:predicted metal-dependent peptidase